MKIFKLTTILAVGFSLLIAQLSAVAMDDSEARDDLKKRLSHAKQLLDDGDWTSLADEAEAIGETSKSLKAKPGESEKQHQKMHDSVARQTAKLATAARDENREKATEAYGELVASVGTKSAMKARSVDNTGRNIRDRDSENPTPMDQGNSQADLDITAQIRKEIIEDQNMSVNARNIKIITNNGQVTLRGPVNTAEEKRRIGEIADQVTRSGNVENQLEVKVTTSRN